MTADSKPKIAITGSGASGCICAYFLLKSGFEVTLFDKNSPLTTLLPTGGGRCNLAHAEFDTRELASNYPRGEKFLYSVFSKFGTAETLEMFEKMGIETYTQDDGRIFPISDSSAEVRKTILKEITKLGGKFVQKEISDISELTDDFERIVIAIGGRSGYGLLKNYGVNIVEPRPSLVGLKTKENFKDLSGVSIKNVLCEGITGDILFTEFGVSGPLIYKISSQKAFLNMPYELKLDLAPEIKDLQEDLNSNPHKEVKNVLSNYLPHKVIEYILKDFDITKKAHLINAKERNFILDKIKNFKICITGTNKGSETVTAGGIDLDEINPKTMELKKVPDVYCIGEVLNIDGFCGGFNLQNAWSTGYVCAQGIIQKDLPKKSI